MYCSLPYNSDGISLYSTDHYLRALGGIPGETRGRVLSPFRFFVRLLGCQRVATGGGPWGHLPAWDPQPSRPLRVHRQVHVSPLALKVMRVCSTVLNPTSAIRRPRRL